jgi:hypothetical protein
LSSDYAFFEREKMGLCIFTLGIPGNYILLISKAEARGYNTHRMWVVL